MNYICKIAVLWFRFGFIIITMRTWPAKTMQREGKVHYQLINIDDLVDIPWCVGVFTT